MMKNLLIPASASSPSARSPVGNPNRTPLNRCKSLVFAIAHYHFALPVPTVQKIIQLNSDLEAAIKQRGFFMFAQYPVSVVDLLGVLGQQTKITDTAEGASVATIPVPCLLLIQANGDPQWALRVADLPKIIDIPLSSIHPIASTHPQPISQLAQYMVIVKSDSVSDIPNEPIFLLDLKQVQPTISQPLQSSPHLLQEGV
ncbi:MAG: chemotaxis protein CheW [Cyanobacteria bacterium P01_F01_bin.150]